MLWARVCDRSADIYEHLQECQQAGHGFVIRASQDRALVVAASDPNSPSHSSASDGRLFPAAREAPALSEFPLELRRRGQQAAQDPRLRGEGSACRNKTSRVPEVGTLVRSGGKHPRGGARVRAEIRHPLAYRGTPQSAQDRSRGAQTLTQDRPLELKVLRLQSNYVLESVQEAAMVLRRLGGHLSRKGDGQL